MFLNAWPNRSRGDAAPPETQTYFDFAVSERPIYTRGSGPRLQKPTPMPSHRNKDGIILDLIEVSQGEHRYLVGSKTRPEMRVSVKMMDILDWVSAKSYEDWNWQRLKEGQQKSRILGLHWKARKKMEGFSDRGSRDDTSGSESGELVSSNMRRMTVEIQGAKVVPRLGLVVSKSPLGPGRRKLSSAGEGMVTLSQPSLTSPPRGKQQRGLAEMIASSESEQEDVHGMDEEDNTNDTLAMKFNRSLAGTPRISRSTTTSREVSTAPSALNKTPQPRKRRDLLSIRNHTKLKETSRPSSSFSSTNNEVKSTAKPISSPPSGNEIMSSRAKSSLLSLTPKPASILPTSKHNSLTSLASPTKSRTTNPTTQKNLKRFFLSGQNLNPKSRKKTPTPSPPPVVNKDAEEVEEWEVDRILAEDRRVTEDGTQILYYLIKWIGEWEDTWEPSENVSKASIKEYKAAKKAEEKRHLESFIKKSGEKHQNGAQRKRKRDQQERGEADFEIDEAPADAGSSFENAMWEKSLKHRRRSTRSGSSSARASLAPSAGLYNGRGSKRPSRSPAVLYSSGLRGLFSDDDDDEGDNDVEMVDADQQAWEEGEEHEEDEGLFVSQTIAPAVNMFGATPSLAKHRISVASGKSNGKDNGKWKEVAPPPPIEIDSSPEIEEDLKPPGKAGDLVIISSGESESEDELA